MTSTLAARPERVAALAAHDHLAESALEVARFAYPRLDPTGYVARLDRMAERVNGLTHLSLRRVVSIAEGLGGNVDNYHDPDNSFLNRVLDTRKGLPITLSVIWMEVGRRAGLEMEGVALPGHFLVYAAGQLCDPFHGGEAIGFDEAAALVAESLGGAPRLDRSWLEPVGSTVIIARLLRNLEQAYLRRGEKNQWVQECLHLVGDG